MVILRLQSWDRVSSSPLYCTSRSALKRIAFKNLYYHDVFMYSKEISTLINRLPQIFGNVLYMKCPNPQSFLTIKNLYLKFYFMKFNPSNSHSILFLVLMASVLNTPMQLSHFNAHNNYYGVIL